MSWRKMQFFPFIWTHLLKQINLYLDVKYGFTEENLSVEKCRNLRWEKCSNPACLFYSFTTQTPEQLLALHISVEQGLC